MSCRTTDHDYWLSGGDHTTTADDLALERWDGTCDDCGIKFEEDERDSTLETCQDCNEETGRTWVDLVAVCGACENEVSREEYLAYCAAEDEAEREWAESRGVQV